VLGFVTSRAIDAPGVTDLSIEPYKTPLTAIAPVIYEPFSRISLFIFEISYESSSIGAYS